EDQGALAIQDIAASEGALVVASQALLPHGPPTTYGPQRREDGRSKKDGKGHGTTRQVEVNPFWSQTVKDEAMLRAMRPAGLPEASTSTTRPTASGGEEMGVDIQEVLRAVMSQNSMLKRELAELKKKVDDSTKEKDRDFKEVMNEEENLDVELHLYRNLGWEHFMLDTQEGRGRAVKGKKWQLGTGATDGGWGGRLSCRHSRIYEKESWDHWWWEEVMRGAMMAYREWLRAEPVQRLHIKAEMPRECNTVWSRLEQRGQLMLLNAVPASIRSEMLANRASNSVDVLYALFRRYQPGGLAERSRLLRQLVEPKTPQTMNEVVEMLRGWRRSLRRAQELEIATPDATLLLGALDKMSELAESLAISDVQPPPEVKPSNHVTKVKAMTTVAEEKAENGVVKARAEGRGEEKPCRFWGTEEGCRKGQDCRFKHDWGGLEKKGRCFGCSGTGHSKKDCPTVKPKVKESPEKQAVKAVKEKVTTIQAKGDMSDGGPKTGGSEPMENGQSSEGDKGAGTSGEMKELLNEATTLLKSLRPSSSMKAIRLSSLEASPVDENLADQGGCPTIDEALSMVRERARLAHLAGEDIGLEVDFEKARLLPKKGWTGEGLPWNRHERRRVRKAKEVIIHLFSGDSRKFWQKELEAENRVVLCIDTVIDQGLNLVRDDIYSFLLDLADSSTVCPKPTLSVLEQPEDPEEYVETDEARGQTYPSYWSWPEWKAFRDPWGMTEVSFDQGPMGHARRKPTRLGTNIAKLTELQDIRGPGVGGNTALAEDLTERIKQSKDWSTWAPGLKMALVTAIRETLKSSEFQ
ncbi:unnamed protein product, partial [Durusdinium trenchii]